MEHLEFPSTEIVMTDLCGKKQGEKILMNFMGFFLPTFF